VGVNAAAVWWLNNHIDLWSQWVTAEAADAIKTALSAGDLPDGWPAE